MDQSAAIRRTGACIPAIIQPARAGQRLWRRRWAKPGRLIDWQPGPRRARDTDQCQTVCPRPTDPSVRNAYTISAARQPATHRSFIAHIRHRRPDLLESSVSAGFGRLPTQHGTAQATSASANACLGYVDGKAHKQTDILSSAMPCQILGRRTTDWSSQN